MVETLGAPQNLWLNDRALIQYNAIVPVVGGGVARAHIGITGYSNYLEDYWPCAGGISAANAMFTQLDDLIQYTREGPDGSGRSRWTP